MDSSQRQNCRICTVHATKLVVELRHVARLELGPTQKPISSVSVFDLWLWCCFVPQGSLRRGGGDREAKPEKEKRQDSGVNMSAWLSSETGGVTSVIV